MVNMCMWVNILRGEKSVVIFFLGGGGGGKGDLFFLYIIFVLFSFLKKRIELLYYLGSKECFEIRVIYYY